MAQWLNRTRWGNSRSLAKHESDLSLGGLTELSDAAAESLAKHEGYLFLNGLTESVGNDRVSG